MNTARVFRLFISSTFSDFVAEREALQKRVFPQLEAYCRERGAAFQAVDLRWGITEEAQRDHDTMRICLEEVRRCQTLTPRPNFAVLLGDRYGWEPVPARIPADHWTRLMAAATPAQRKTLRAGYRGPDRNAVPAVYHLRPRVGDWADSQARETTLREALRAAAAGFAGDERLPYFASATHQEIALGALAQRDAQGRALQTGEHVSLYLRRIEDLPQAPVAQAYLDWDEATSSPVAGARERLRALEVELTERLPDRTRRLTTRWTGQGIDTAYLDDFCEQFLQDQRAVIERELQQAVTEDAGEVRARAHRDFARDRARNFRGRVALRARIARYLQGAVQAPLILCGDGGTGKSALMAQAFHDASADDGPAVVMARFIGGVPGTENLYNLLTSLTADLARALDQAEPAPAQTVRAAREAFASALAWPTAQRPLVLFLDALDQLEQQDGAWLLDWLPTVLGPHTRVVASTRGGPVLASARRRYPKRLLQVPAMKPAEARQMLQAWLQDAREAHYNAGIAPSRERRLTPAQRGALLTAFAESGKPLWLKLAYEEARTWPSWFGQDDSALLSLPGTVEAMVRRVIGARLLEADDHPAVFARHALAFITAGRMGVSEEELAYALATHAPVRHEFEAQVARTGQHWQDADKLPPILWSRLYFDLQPYLTWASIDGALLCRWFHREFKEEIERQLLGTDAQRREIHGHLAHTFEKLAPQGDDLFEHTDASRQQQTPALRRVMEQPWQLTRAGAHAAARRLLLDFGFCMGKCAANRARDLFLDVVGVAAPGSEAGSVQALERFLRTRLHVLERGESEWPAHRILLQLATDYGQDNPITRAARQWMANARIDWSRLEKVVFQPEAPPTGVMWVTSDHSHRHAYERASSGVTVDADELWTWDTGHVCHWDPATGQALHIEALPPTERLTPVGKLALVVESGERACAVYHPMTGQCLWRKRFPTPVRWAQAVGDDAIAVVDGAHTRILDLQDGSLRQEVSHTESQWALERWKKMVVEVWGGRWLIYQHVPRTKPQRQEVASISHLTVYDLQDSRLVYVDDIEGLERPLDHHMSFLSERNPLGLRLLGDQLMLWVGQWRVLDLGAPMMGLRDLEASLRAKVPPAAVQPQGVSFSNWDDFIPLQSNDTYQVFKFAHLLVAWQLRSGRVIYCEVEPLLHRESQAIRWGGPNTLVVLGHERSRAVEPAHNFLWHLDDDTREVLAVPALERPVILASRGDVLILSRDYRYDTNQGDYAQSEPLIAHDLATGTSRVIHDMNRVVGYTSMFRHAWLPSGELVVLDGDNLVCLRTDQGALWQDRVDTSLGSMLTVVEDVQHASRFMIMGNRRCLHIDLSGPSPSVQAMAHDFEWGAACELAGDLLFLWEDDNAMSEIGMPGQFVLWRRDGKGRWAPDPATFMEFLCAEAPDFDMMSSYAATRLGDVFLIGQSGFVHAFEVGEAGHLVLRDTLKGPFEAETFWIRGDTLYVPDAQDEAVMHAASQVDGRFGPLTAMPREDIFQPGEIPLVNVRPFRDMAAGPLRGARLFVVGDPAEDWTVWDGAFKGQARDHLCFAGPDGQEARWYGLHACRILRHRIDYRHLPGRDLFQNFGGEGDVRSLVLDDDVYFVCEDDGSGWMVKLIAA